MHIVIVSGRSGSGKSAVLNILEDMNWYCIDNLPASLSSQLIENLAQNHIHKVAISIDARNNIKDIEKLPSIILEFLERKIHLDVIYLDALDNTLVERFSETRRKHPLTNNQTTLLEAILLESKLLTPVNELANIHINTSNLKQSQLQQIIIEALGDKKTKEMVCVIESFAFKKGLDFDADLVFDARLLPNPYWEKELRPFSGLDEKVQAFLSSKEEVQAFCKDLLHFLSTYLPQYQKSDRAYFKIAVGCTGGFHRSVYVANFLYTHLLPQIANLQIRHRDINNH
jgi:UPF0042 nucleotide-binding protein